MKILVTGGAGFMGSNFIRYILNKYPDYEIVNLDKLTYCGNLDNLKDLVGHPHYTFLKGDIANERDVGQALREKVNVIINFAAETHVDRSIMNPRDFVMTDVIGTYNLLESLKKHNIKKYIQISTDEVYGSIEEGEFNEEGPFRPNSPYAASKAGADLLCRSYLKTYKLPIIVTHSCNFMGPYQYPEKLIPLFVTNMIEGKKVPVYGDGKNVRQWIYTADACQAFDLILHRGQLGEVYNIAAGIEKNNLEITRAILQEFGQGEEMIEYVKDRPGHDRRYALNWDKIKKLGFKPTFDFTKALSETVKWYRQNEWWWQKIKSGEYREYYQAQYGKR
jgi:dTDP-glucose 4,6-dehydratase